MDDLVPETVHLPDDSFSDIWSSAQHWANISSQQYSSLVNIHGHLSIFSPVVLLSDKVEQTDNYDVIIHHFIAFFAASSSVWFNDSTIGLMAGFIFWFLTYFPHFFLAFYYDSLPLYV